ncbi:hypothetical protein EDD21DRAFT_383142 [Dissophora ornata]|nr:hypothetical protein EDD21DRAFT_383142 [Dissophora ornata]
MNASSDSHTGTGTGTNQQQQQDMSSLNNANNDQQQFDDDAAADAKKKKTGPKRRKVTHACVYCRRSHMTCDDGRPCQRCIKRNIGHLCHDEPKPSQLAQNQGANGNEAKRMSPPSHHQQQQGQTGQSQHQQLQQHLQNNSLSNLSLYGFNNSLTTLPVTPLTFASEHMGNEFTVISDFLESLGGDTQDMFPEQGIPVNTTEKFFLTAANPGDGTNEDRLTQVINAKFEAGFLKPYNYVNGYSRLQKYMDSNMSNISRQRILNVMGTFRPAFRSVAQSLTDIDLVLVEEAFERLLLDYDRVFSSMGIPACLWRRTGEIYKGNKEFAALVNVPLEVLREGRLCIYELMAEESAVNYWEKYGNIAFDAGQKAVLTSCLLKNPDPESQNVISCCFSFTIRRDRYNIPTVIVGNFLPVSLG